MPTLYFPFTARLQGHMLACLCDHDFVGMDSFYRIKDCWKGRDVPRDLLFRPLERGLPLKIGEWCFDTLFDVDEKSELMKRPYFSGLGHEGFLWFLEDVVEAAKRAYCCDHKDALDDLAAHLNTIPDLLAGDEAEYARQVKGEGRRTLVKLFLRFCRSSSAALSEMRVLYSHEIADRIVHDRQLCHFVAETLIDIGFPGETVDGFTQQWVERQKWPSWVKIALASERPRQVRIVRR